MNKLLRVYLAHPIATKWGGTLTIKDSILLEMGKHLPQVEILDPLRYNLDDNVHGPEIVKRNIQDIMDSDAVLADFTHPSSGVAMECLTAKFLGKPVVSFTLREGVSVWVNHVSTMSAHTIEGLIMALKMTLKA